MDEVEQIKAKLSIDELLIYASVCRDVPLNLPPFARARLHEALDAMDEERVKKSRGWRVDRRLYRLPKRELREDVA
jgi:hypothetical protein